MNRRTSVSGLHTALGSALHKKSAYSHCSGRLPLWAVISRAGSSTVPQEVFSPLFPETNGTITTQRDLSSVPAPPSVASCLRKPLIHLIYYVLHWRKKKTRRENKQEWVKQGTLDQVTEAWQKELQWPRIGRAHSLVRGCGDQQIAKKWVFLSQTHGAV